VKTDNPLLSRMEQCSIILNFAGEFAPANRQCDGVHRYYTFTLMALGEVLTSYFLF
jgi:hypothetical protein